MKKIHTFILLLIFSSSLISQCDLFSITSDCDSICFTINQNNLDCVGLRILNLQTNQIEDLLISNNGETVTSCIPRIADQSYSLAPIIHPGCAPESITCEPVVIEACAECGEDPPEVNFKCTGNGNEACAFFGDEPASTSTEWEVLPNCTNWAFGQSFPIGIRSRLGEDCPTLLDTVTLPDCTHVDDPCGPRPDIILSCDLRIGMVCAYDRDNLEWLHEFSRYQYCPNQLGPCFNYVPETFVSFTICEWGDGNDCETASGCCWTYRLQIPYCPIIEGGGNLNDPPVQSRASNLESELKEFQTISVTPNPVYDELSINARIADASNYEVIDIAGQTILKGKINSSSAKINTSELLSGTYFLRIVDFETKNRYQSKFVKMR